MTNVQSIQAYGRHFPDLLSAAAHMRAQPGVCISCGHARHDGLLAPCGVYADGGHNCRCLATVVLTAQTVYSKGPVD